MAGYTKGTRRDAVRIVECDAMDVRLDVDADRWAAVSSEFREDANEVDEESFGIEDMDVVART